MNIGDQSGETVSCPYCGSTETYMENAKGSGLCRSFYYCEACDQAFERLA